MATTVEGLFNLPTEAQAGQQYYEGLLTSPGQMNNLSLMQQISALGANAGAGVGYAGGRLLGVKPLMRFASKG
jgi:membrane protein DedA with SNARE-associated domain